MLPGWLIDRLTAIEMKTETVLSGRMASQVLQHEEREIFDGQADTLFTSSRPTRANVQKLTEKTNHERYHRRRQTKGELE